jgi:hypothetical protein
VTKGSRCARILGAVLVMLSGALGSCRHAPARAGAWLELGKSGGGTIFVDSVTMQVADHDHARVTVRFEPFEPTHVPGIAAPVVAMETVESVDCTQKTALVDSVQAFDSTGHVVLALGRTSSTPKDLGVSGPALCEVVARRSGSVRRS